MSQEDTTPQGVETGPNESKALDSKQVEQASTPPKDNASDEVAELRKQLEQQNMRANQLANQLEEKRKAEEAAEAKKLEEKEEFKTLYEQEREARLKLEQETEEKARKAEINSKKSEVLAEFPQDVKELAEEFGYELTNIDDATVEAYKSKLLKVQEKISQGQEVSPNNPAGPKKAPIPEGNDLKMALKNPQTFDEIIAAKFPGIQQMTRPKQ